jgi:tRNA (mo5U34)-methyltransferase
MLDKDTAASLIEGKPWHHSFEIVPGVRTKGNYDPAALFRSLGLPDDMTGLTLADVGASNGYFSFEARRRGARVVAFDFRHKDNSGFGLAQHINGMTDIEHHQVNVVDLDASRHGKFDIVLALGLLYHVADPYRVLANCAGMAVRSLYLESYCIDAMVEPGLREQPLMRFISDPLRFPDLGDVGGDRSNFWGFTALCLRRMTEDVGFEVERLAVHNDRVFLHATRERPGGVAPRQWLAYGLQPVTPAGADRNDPASWFVF